MKKIEKWAQKNKIPKLLKALSVEDADIRIAAIKALGMTKDEGAMYTLTTLLSDSNAAIRTATVEALGNMGNSRSLEFVRQLWNSESDEKVREKAKLAINAIKANISKEDSFK
jgi:HEAT repeat protein